MQFSLTVGLLKITLLDEVWKATELHCNWKLFALCECAVHGEVIAQNMDVRLMRSLVVKYEMQLLKD